MNSPIEDLIREWIELEREWREQAKLCFGDCHRDSYLAYSSQAASINKCRVQLQEAVKKMEAEKTCE